MTRIPQQGDNPGPDGVGCGEPWEGWWDQSQGEAAPPFLAAPEAYAQFGRWRANGHINVPAVYWLFSNTLRCYCADPN